MTEKLRERIITMYQQTLYNEITTIKRIKVIGRQSFSYFHNS